MSWTIFWVITAAIVLFLEVTAISISLVEQHYQAEPAEKHWKSLYHIHNPPEDAE